MRIRLDSANEKGFKEIAKHFRERLPTASDNQIGNALLQEAIKVVKRTIKEDKRHE